MIIIRDVLTEITDLLFEIPSVFVVNEDQIQVISYRELLVHVAHRRR